MRLLILSPLIVLFFVSSLAHAQFYTGTIAGGTGGAGRAAIDPAESAYLNPAAVAHLQRYYFSGQYQMGDFSSSPGSQSDFSRYAFQISDGSPQNLIPGAFSYVHNALDLTGGAGKLKQDDFQISLGGLVYSKVAFGLAVHHLIQKTDRPIGAGSNSTKDNQTNLTAGLIFTPTETVGIALVGYDLYPNSEAAFGTELNPVYALATNILLMERFRVRLDFVRPTIGARDRTDVMAGLESFIREDLAFRLGSQWKETAGETNITAGFGYKGPRLSVDYSFQKDIRSEGLVRHLVDLWLPL